MSSYLLDINVLIARCDPGHALHARASSWFRTITGQMIVTCPIVENGFVRILGHPNYPGGPGSVSGAMRHLRLLRSLPQHRFVQDGLSLDSATFRDFAGVGSRALTDLYLLGLAAENSLKFATFDRRIDPRSVENGIAALHLLPA